MSAPAKQIMNTPRTDAADSACGVSGDFARTLERELGEAKAELAIAKQHEDEWTSVGLLIHERDQLRAEVERLKRGEFICAKCGLRKDSDHAKGDF